MSSPDQSNQAEGERIPPAPPPSNSQVFTHAGTQYLIGGGKDYFGIWERARYRKPPVWLFPRTDSGWRDAWRQFSSLEPNPTTAFSMKRIGLWARRKRSS